MKIKIVSDLHIEFYNSFRKMSKRFGLQDCNSDNADVLALCGDIGYPGSSIYHDFIDCVAKQFGYVLIITGNHEYYATNSRKWSADEVDQYLHQLVEEWPNVYFLYNDKIVIKGYKFLGTTLWTKISPEDYHDAQSMMNDYKRIYESVTRMPNGKKVGKPISVGHTLAWHEQAVKFLRTELVEVVPTVVLTHHSPLLYCTRGGSLRTAYATDLQDMIVDHIVLWGYGHTHYPQDFVASNNTTRIVSNPVGYPGELAESAAEIIGKQSYSLPDNCS